MIQHAFQTTVARSPEAVFDFLVDLRNAPQWEPNCQQVENTSDGPLGNGTTFRAKKGMGRLDSEIIEFERPGTFRQSRQGARDGMRSGTFAATPRMAARGCPASCGWSHAE